MVNIIDNNLRMQLHILIEIYKKILKSVEQLLAYVTVLINNCNII